MPGRCSLATRCTSAFPNGEVRFVEDRSGPPSRAYLKLWEALTLIGRQPGPGERCLDLGSSPGGWSWALQRMGAQVISVDKAPLAPAVARLPGIEHRLDSAFALDPAAVGPVDWLFSDVVCYPARLLALVERWLAAGTCRNFVCTIKFQGETDHATAGRFRRHPRLPTAPSVSQQARVDLDQNRLGYRHCEELSDEAISRLPRRLTAPRNDGGGVDLGEENAMELGLRGKKALVTGASKGIGRACAEVLAEEGCDVVLVSRTAADLEAARAAIVAKHNVAVRLYPLDLSDSRNVDRLAAECSDTDLLVNNAGAIPGGNIAQIDEGRWRTAWDLKVFGYINMTRRFYALMAQRKKGVIINILGAAGENPDFDYIAGSSGNASLMAFTRAMGGTAPRDGLRVIGINPGPVMTDRLITLMRTRAQTQFGDAERWTEYMKPLAFGRAAKPEEIAWMTAFLASDHSAYTTGSIITIDGGGSSRRSAL